MVVAAEMESGTETWLEGFRFPAGTFMFMRKKNSIGNHVLVAKMISKIVLFIVSQIHSTVIFSLLPSYTGL